jgi:hypothetical protein
MTQVFISYSRKDLVFVERLAKDLQAAGLQVWYDLSGLEGGTRWGREIQNAIKQSQVFVVVLSPNSIDSEWVEKEFMYANSLKLKIIPLLYQPCETPMWFINLHFIDVQGANYDNHLWIILKVIGVKPEDQAKEIKPIEGPVSIQDVPAIQIQPAQPVSSKAQETAHSPRKIKLIPALLIGLMGLAAVLAYGIWGMPALAARLAPTSTSTATDTQPPTATVISEPTSVLTPTLTQVPSLTFTPQPTFDTKTGIVNGSIGWNNQPLAGVLVKLCTKWLYTCSGDEFTGLTGADGKYTISGVTPGKYQVITKYPSQNDETRMLFTSGTGRAGLPMVIIVVAGQNTYLGAVSICKDDLVLYAPVIKGNSVTFSWQAYPGADSYDYGVDGTNIAVYSSHSTSFTATLKPGTYQWSVDTRDSSGPCTGAIGNITVP